MTTVDLFGAVPKFNPDDHGIGRRFKDGQGGVDHAQWLRAIAEGHHVGTCRRCGDELIPARPWQVNGNRTDYEAVCRACEWVVLMPGGRCRTRKDN